MSPETGRSCEEALVFLLLLLTLLSRQTHAHVQIGQLFNRRLPKTITGKTFVKD